MTTMLDTLASKLDGTLSPGIASALLDPHRRGEALAQSGVVEALGLALDPLFVATFFASVAMLVVLMAPVTRRRSSRQIFSHACPLGSQTAKGHKRQPMWNEVAHGPLRIADSRKDGSLDFLGVLAVVAALAVAGCGVSPAAGADGHGAGGVVIGGASGAENASASSDTVASGSAGTPTVGGGDVGGGGIGGSAGSSGAAEAGADVDAEGGAVVAPYVCRGAGTSLQFDGDQIDEVVADLMTDMPAGDASRTIEMWVYTTPKTWRVNHFLFDVGTTGGGKMLGVAFGGRWQNSMVVQGGYPDLEIFSDKANDYGFIAPFTPPSPNYEETGWVHMAMTYSTDTKNYAVITNGKTVFEAQAILHGHLALRTEPTPIHIGFSEGFGLEGFDGKIDELRIWNKSRTNAEISNTMRAILKGDEEGLVGNWHFDEGAGTVARDATKGHHDATMVSAVRPMWVASEGLVLTCP